jgi:hypothetical protein
MAKKAEGKYVSPWTFGIVVTVSLALILVLYSCLNRDIDALARDIQEARVELAYMKGSLEATKKESTEIRADVSDLKATIEAPATFREFLNGRKNDIIILPMEPPKGQLTVTLKDLTDAFGGNAKGFDTRLEKTLKTVSDSMGITNILSTRPSVEELRSDAKEGKLTPETQVVITFLPDFVFENWRK